MSAERKTSSAFAVVLSTDVKLLYQHFNARFLGTDLHANIETFSEGRLAAVLTS
jgi:phage head maturation protease